MSVWKQSKNNVFVAAHRGFSERYPENTMTAFRETIALGVDQIETDVRITGDGQLVLIHDEALDRTTNGSGLVREHTLSQIRSLSAGLWKGEDFAGERVPLFEELLDMVKDLPAMTLDIELKEYPTAGREAIAFEVADRVIAMLDKASLTDRCVINTFSARLHEYLYKTYGGRLKHHVFYPLRHMGECTLDPYSYGYCCCMFGQTSGMAEPEEFEAMRQKGVRTWAGAFVKDETTLDMALACGAELITCNNPDVILDLLRKKGVHR